MTAKAGHAKSHYKPAAGNPGGGLNTFVWGMGLLAIVWILRQKYLGHLGPQRIEPEAVSLTEFVRLTNPEGLAEGEAPISKIIYSDDAAMGQVLDDSGEVVSSYTTEYDSFDTLREALMSTLGSLDGLDISYVAMNTGSVQDTAAVFTIIASLGFIVLCLMAISFMLSARREQGLTRNGPGGGAVIPQQSSFSFEDVAGIDPIKEEVEESIEFLKDGEKGKKFGIKAPKGVLLSGPPGTGKTLLAKAMAGEAGVPFYSISAADIQDKFFGESTKRIKAVFEEARKNAPCIIFIDEVDSLLGKRDGGLGRGHKADDDITRGFLEQMDGFTALDNVLVIGATNRPEALDPAALRPGRFDRKITVSLPDVRGREDILNVHLKKRNTPLAQGVTSNELAKMAYGFSGADLENWINEAAIIASRRAGANTVTVKDFEEALDRIALGIKRPIAMSDADKLMTAYHEGGHTICTLEKEPEGATPLHGVTIMPHGNALGVTMSRPDEDKYSQSEKELKARLVVLYGGRVAEELVYGKENVTTGAGSDIEQATKIARAMVTQYGFSKLGPIKLEDGQDGHLGYQQGGVNPSMGAKIDEEVTRILNEAEDEARALLEREMPRLKKLADALMVEETMSGDDVRKLLKYPQKVKNPAPKPFAL